MLKSPSFSADIALCQCSDGSFEADGVSVSCPFLVKRLVLFGRGLSEGLWFTVTQTYLARHVYKYLGTFWPVFVAEDVAVEFSDLIWEPAISHCRVPPERGGPQLKEAGWQGERTMVHGGDAVAGDVLAFEGN